MKIKRDSRYYKIMKTIYEPYGLPQNVCQLFWGTLFFSVLVLVGVPFLLMLVLTISYLMLILPFEMWGITNFGLVTVDNATAFLSMFWWVVAGWISIGVYRHSDNYPAKQKSTDNDHTPNIVIEYLKAKKQKLCPLVEYVD